MVLVDDRHVIAYAHVLVEDGPLHRGALAHPHGYPSLLTQGEPLLSGFEIVRSQQQGVLKHHLVLYPGANTQHAVVNTAGLKQGTLADDRGSYLGILELAGW